MSKLQASQNLGPPLHTADRAYLQTDSHTGARQEHTQENPRDSFQGSQRGRKALGIASHLQLLLGELCGPCPVLLAMPLQKCPHLLSLCICSPDALMHPSPQPSSFLTVLPHSHSQQQGARRPIFPQTKPRQG